MTKAAENQALVGLDVGTSQVRAMIAQPSEDGKLNILGSCTVPSRGMDRGGVNDLESVVNSVNSAIDGAMSLAVNDESGIEFDAVSLSISGEHVKCQNEKGMVPISGGNGSGNEREVTQEDIDNVIYTARSVKISDEHQILHVIPQEFTIDLQKGIKNPLGLSGVRMESSVHLVTCHNDMARNIIKAVERSGLKVGKAVFSGLASSEAVLNDDEKELGVCLIDMGAGTMDIAIWAGGALRHSEVIPYAGNTVTGDIAYAFGSPPDDAESLKIKHGCALSELVSKDAKVEVKSVGGRPSRSLQRQTLAEIIEPRYSELFGLVNEKLQEIQEQLREKGVKHQLAAGVVLTGGAVQMEGLVECAERVFRNQVRIGVPGNLTGFSRDVQTPEFSTVVGLLRQTKDNQTLESSRSAEPRQAPGQSMVAKIGSWFKKEFYKT